MSKSSPQSKIYLVQPLDKAIYKEMIVYADNESDARKAAAVKAEDIDKNNTNKTADIYLEEGLSICIQISPEIVQAENNGHNKVKVKYKEVNYELNKNFAEVVIAEEII